MHFTQRFGRAGPHRRAGPRRPFPSLPPAQVPDTSSEQRCHRAEPR